MIRFSRPLPDMTTPQLVMLLDFFDGEPIRRHYTGLRADIRAALTARGVSEAELAELRAQENSGSSE